MRKIALLVLVFCFCGSAAFAQLPGGNIFFGYSYANAALATNSRANLNGWKTFPSVGIVADLGGYYGSQTLNVPNPVNASGSVYTVMFDHKSRSR